MRAFLFLKGVGSNDGEANKKKERNLNNTLSKQEQRRELLEAAVGQFWRAVQDQYKCHGDDCNMVLYVYENGCAIMDTPDCLLDHNYFASAPVGDYANKDALLAELGGSVADE